MASPKPNENHEIEYVLSPVPTAGGGDFSLQSVGRFLRRRVWTFLAATALGGLAAYGVTARMPKLYTSSVTLLLDDSRQGSAQALDMLERTNLDADFATELALMRGRSVMEAVVEDLDLHVRVLNDAGSVPAIDVVEDLSASKDVVTGSYSVELAEGGFRVLGADSTTIASGRLGDIVSFGGVAFRVPEDLSAPVRLVLRPFDRAAAALIGQVSVSALGRNSEFVDLRCKGPNPSELQKTCQAVAENYLVFRRSVQLSRVKSAAGILNQQTEEVKGELEEAEDRLRKYQALNQGLAIEQRAAAGVAQLVDLSAQRLQLDAERSALSGLIFDIKNGSGPQRSFRHLASFPTFAQSSNVSGLLSTLVSLDNERSDRTLTRSDQNVDVQNLDKRIADVERQLEAMALSYEEALAARIASLDGAMSQASGQLEPIPERQLEVARLGRQVAGLDEMYRFLQQRLREAQVAEVMDLPNVRVVDSATRPSTPSSPRTRLNLAIGLFLGFCIGGAFALVREDMDERVHARSDVEKAVDAPIVGLLPILRTPGPILEFAPPSANGNGADKTDSKSPMKNRDRLMSLEAFRGLVADLRFIESSLPNRSLRSIAITSAERGDGKTFVACNLALAHVGMKIPTLLIDVDARATGAGRFLGFHPNTPGLTEILAKEKTTEPTTHEILVEHRRGLTVMTAGTRTGEITQLLGDPGLDELLHDAKNRHAVVIIDTPPLSILADAAAVGRAVDGVLLVVREGATSREAIRHSVERLDRAGANVIGVVLNGSRLPGYYKGYKYGYGYGSKTNGA